MPSSIPYLTALAGVAAIAATFFSTHSPSLIFNQQVAMHQPYQFITSHFTHGDWEHLWWNLCALGVVSSVLELRCRGRWWSAMLLGFAAVNGFLMSSLSAVQYYVGLSGVLNTLLFVSLWELRKDHGRLSLGLAMACAAKIAFEMTSTQSMFTNISWPPYPAAHLAGLVGALSYIFLDVTKAGAIYHLPLQSGPAHSVLLAARNSTGCQSCLKDTRRLDP
jgi:rhomboid family GlyGly-CTERM serine protease